jgi:hypothetical protein
MTPLSGPDQRNHFHSPEIRSFSPSSESILSGRVTEFSWDTGNSIFAGIWILLLVDSVSRFFGNCGAYVERPELESAEKECIVSSAVLGGTVANSLHWADSVNLISLGEGAAVCKAFGYGSSAVVAFFATVDAASQLYHACQEGEEGRSQRILSFFSLGYRVSTLAWAILGIAAFFAGAVVAPSVMTILFLTSFLFFIAEMTYRARLERQDSSQEHGVLIQPA